MWPSQNFLTLNIFSTRTGEPSSVYQVYQEDAPSRIDRIDVMGNLEKLADNKLFKRIDLFAPFRRRKQPKRRPNRPGKRPQILKPVENTKKVKRKPEPDIAPKPALDNPALSVQEEIRTGKSLSEAFILGLNNPQYDKRLFIDLPVQ